MTRQSLTIARLITGAALAVVGTTYIWAARHANVILLVKESDAWVHLAAIRRTTELGLFPGDLFYLGEPTPPYYSLSHIVFALLTYLTGVPAHELLIESPWVLVFADLGAVYLFLYRLTGDRRVAVVGAAVELAIFMPTPPVLSLNYPRNFAIAPFYFAWYAYLRGRPECRWWWLAGSGLGLGVCLAIHLLTGGLCLIGLALLDQALVRGWPRSSAPLLLVTGCALALSSPWLASFAHAWRLRTPAPHHAFQIVWDGWTFAPDLGLQILQPAAFFHALPGALWVAVTLGTAQSLRRLWCHQGTAADRFAGMALTAGVLLVLTPLFGIAVKLFGVWAPRLMLLMPLALLAGWGAALLLDVLGARLDWRMPWLMRTAALCLLAWIAFAATASVTGPVRQRGEMISFLRAHGPLGIWDLEARLAQTGPLPHVVLSDPETAYLLPYFLGSYVVSATAGHGSPYVDHTEREKAVTQFFQTATKAERLYQILEERGVDMVAVRRGSTWSGERLSRMLLMRLRRTPGFVDTGCCDSVVFFRFVGRPTSGPRRGEFPPG